MNTCLLMMGGSGTRFGADRPKQFLEIDAKPIFAHILAKLNATKEIDSIIIVTNKDWSRFVEQWCARLHAEKVYAIVSGGATRSESVKNGLIKASEITSDNDVILIHDATHPYVDQCSMSELIEAVKTHGAATMAQRQYDTCYYIDGDDMITDIVPRQNVVSGASPEAFLFGEIYKIYREASTDELDRMTSAGAIAMAHGIKMKVCTLHTINLKITYPEDMEILEHSSEFFLN